MDYFSAYMLYYKSEPKDLWILSARNGSGDLNFFFGELEGIMYNFTACLQRFGSVKEV